MNTEHLLEITLTLKGPVLVKSSNPAAFGLDTTVARVAIGAEQGKVYIPGTLLKGKLAESLAQLAMIDPRLERLNRDWLGVHSDQPGSNNDPYRGRLMIDDLIAITSEEKSSTDGVRTRIKINEALGSVDEKMLQVTEMPFAPGLSVEFKGQARFFADEDKALEVERFVRTGLHWLTQVGADRSVGFGRLKRVCVKRIAGRKAESTLPKGVAPVALDIVIRPLGPLCISKHKIGGNLFESEMFIPGNVLKGALAETWAALAGGRLNNGVAGLDDSKRSALKNNFENLRFRHAFPALAVPERQRPQAVPHSVVKAKHGKQSVIRDVAAQGDPAVFVFKDNPNTDCLIAPAFRTDWKATDFEKVDPHFGWAHPAKELRVRTAIDSKKRRADKGNPDTGVEPEGKLFAWEMVHPFTSKGKKVVWHSRVDLCGVNEADLADVAEQLAELLSVLSFVSKTKAPCEVAIKSVLPVSNTVHDMPETVAIVLQTPALLCDPRFQYLTGGTQKSGTLSFDNLHQHYAAVWESKEFAEGALTLKHFFASQSLAGGDYLHRRFRKDKAYNPWLLTDAGSVFVFQVTNTAKARTVIDKWVERGLPLPKWAETVWGCDWKTNPYLRENGFGEIAVHSPHKETPALSDGEFIPLNSIRAVTLEEASAT